MRFATIDDAEHIYSVVKGHIDGLHSVDWMRVVLMREPAVIFDDAVFVFSPVSSSTTFCVHPFGTGKGNVEKMLQAMSLMESIGAKTFVAMPVEDDGRVIRFFEKAGFTVKCRLENAIFRDSWKAQLLMAKGG